MPDNFKAELVNGEIVLIWPNGAMPSRAGGSVYMNLRQYEGMTPGRAYPPNVGFRVLPNRESFSPDVAWYTGQSRGMGFVEGAPIFAVEVRSEHSDYGSTAEQTRAAKRNDYFAAGTQVVWDVDLLGLDVIKCYEANNSTTPRVFRRGDIADAEPAVPGWRIAVDELFR